MGRSESKDAYNTSKQMAQQNQGNAQAALGSENQAIGDFRKSIGDYKDYIFGDYMPGGRFMQNAAARETSANSAGENSLEDYFANVGKRTGAGTTPQMVASAEEASRQGRRDVAQAMASDEMAREAALGHGLETITSDYGSIPGMYGSQYQTSIGGANSQMESATNAAKTPGFWDTFLPALVQGGAAVGAAAVGAPKPPAAPAGNV